MYHKRNDEEPVGQCLECGEMMYGRTDKKFCSTACKNKYNYKVIRESNLFRGKVIRCLNSNYRILSELICTKTDSIGLMEIEVMGFKPDIYTHSRNLSGGKCEKRCFDIRYYQTSKQIFKISRIPTY